MLYGYFLDSFHAPYCIKPNRAVTILTRQLCFNHCASHKPYEKSAVVIMVVVSGFLSCAMFLTCVLGFENFSLYS